MEIFEFSSYREYLQQTLPTKGKQRGARTRLAHSLGCRLGYISNVLKGLQNFSLEQGKLIAEFLSLNTEEEEYFLLLLQYERAGSHKLQSFFQRQIDSLRSKRAKIRNRIQRQDHKIDEEEIAYYYSSWLPAAIHVLSAIPEFQNRKALSAYLRLSEKQLNEPIERMLKAGLLEGRADSFTRGASRVHLDSSSVHVRRHHGNWRLKAIEAIDRAPLDNLSGEDRLQPLNYSLAMSLSKADAKKIRNLLLKAIASVDKILAPSKEETAVCLNLDLFEI